MKGRGKARKWEARKVGGAEKLVLPIRKEVAKKRGKQRRKGDTFGITGEKAERERVRRAGRTDIIHRACPLRGALWTGNLSAESPGRYQLLSTHPFSKLQK